MGDYSCLEGLTAKKIYTGKELLALLRMGDMVESLTRTIGIKPCAGCKKRKDWLNGENRTSRTIKTDQHE